MIWIHHRHNLCTTFAILLYCQLRLHNLFHSCPFRIDASASWGKWHVHDLLICRWSITHIGPYGSLFSDWDGLKWSTWGRSPHETHWQSFASPKGQAGWNSHESANLSLLFLWKPHAFWRRLRPDTSPSTINLCWICSITLPMVGMFCTSKTKATMGIHLTNVGRPKPYHDIEQPSCVHHSLCHSLFLPPPWGLYMIPIDLLLIPIPLWTMIPTFLMLHKLSWVHTLLGGMFQTHIFYT